MKVTFIPPQHDPSGSSTTRTHSQSAFRLLLQDLATLFKYSYLILDIVRPLRTRDPTDELYLHGASLREMLAIDGIGTVGASLLCAFPAIMFLPGWLVVLMYAIGAIVVKVASCRLNGPALVYSQMTAQTKEEAARHPAERWIFLNGIQCGHHALQENVNRLSLLFGRSILGIHNTTYGLTTDLLECLIQRDLSYNTLSVRIAYDHIKAALASPEAKRVILIAHSQGGIVASLVLDGLFTDVPLSELSKLEVYTFGSAANHFNNPFKRSSSSQNDSNRIPITNTGNGQELRDRYIEHIEHYCNSKDMVTRWGVLHSASAIQSNRFSGSIFVREGGTGHMLNQHYLSFMFPVTGPQEFLDSTAECDFDMVKKRKISEAVMGQGMRRLDGLEQKNRVGVFEDGVAEEVEKWLRKNGGNRSVVDVELGPSGSVLDNSNRDSSEDPSEVGPALEKKTVRDLSRLWRYLGGGCPD